MKTVDVLIIGLGPGGAAAAKEAAKAGLSVLAIDKNKVIGEPVQCAEFIPLPMGSYAKESYVQPIKTMKSILPSEKQEVSAFPGLMINRNQFDQALTQKAQNNGAKILTHALFKGFSDQNQAELSVNQEKIIINYKVLIAADGPHSPVAHALGLPHLEIVYTRQYSTVLLKDYTSTDIWLSDEYPGGYAWLFPKGEVANIGLGADKKFLQDLKTPLDKLHKKLIEQGLVGSEIISRTGGAIPVGGLREKLYYNNILFVGDAAGLTHPITGAGISAAVVSGEQAGQAAVAYLQGNFDAFSDYEEDMRDQFEEALNRAVKRRKELCEVWHTESAKQDGVMRRGWIAFPEYFA